MFKNPISATGLLILLLALLALPASALLAPGLHTVDNLWNFVHQTLTRSSHPDRNNRNIIFVNNDDGVCTQFGTSAQCASNHASKSAGLAAPCRPPLAFRVFAAIPER